MPEKIDFGNFAGPSKKVIEITSFAGIDLSSAPADIDKRRSPDAPNMMPDSEGNPIKRTGFSFIRNYGDRINGMYSFGGHSLVHAGDSLYSDGEKIWDGMADGISSAQVVGDKMYIFDGFEALVFNGYDAHPLCDEAYIPTVLISKNADECERETVLKGDGMSTIFSLEHDLAEIKSLTVNGSFAEYALEGEVIRFGAAPPDNSEIIIRARYENEPGGAVKEEYNLISSRWKESFLCDTGTEKNFTLSQGNLSVKTVRAWIMDEKGTFVEKTEGKDFSVDREKGKISFSSAIPKTPIVGEDNLIIEAAKYFEGYENRINRCMRSITFDTGGASTRIFLCGNPEEPRKDFWCAAGDPTYWPDTYYSELCAEGSEILGYSVIENMLAAYISDPKDGRSIVIRRPQIDENGNAVFPIERHLQGESAVCPKSFCFMDREQLFLTARGVYAITAEDISGEKYTQNRSYFINRALCEEPGIENAFCVKWKEFYVIALNGKLWLLDTGKRSYQKGEPLSSFQYECYLWTGIGARVLWEKDGVLFFGDEKGNVFHFMNDRDSSASYEDKLPEGSRAISAYWTVPDFSGDTFWRNKTIRIIALELAPYVQNKVRLEAKINGIWKALKEWTGKMSYFSWKSINWEDFAWSGSAMPRTITLKTKIKKFDKVGFRIVCDDIDRAFGLYGFSLEFAESGRYKK